MCSSTIARSAYGWCTPTTLSSGGSTKATGVTTTREMRLGLTRSPGRLDGQDRHVEVEQQALGVAADDELADRGAAAQADHDQAAPRSPRRPVEGLDEVVAVVGVVDASRHPGRGGPRDELVGGRSRR